MGPQRERRVLLDEPRTGERRTGFGRADLDVFRAARARIGEVAVVPQQRELAAEARAIAGKIATALDYVGVLAVEMFVVPDGNGARVLVNEIAPRVHNSGHWTLDGATISQFEQHIRAIAGWPLGKPIRHGRVTMTNLIGDDILLSGEWDTIDGNTRELRRWNAELDAKVPLVEGKLGVALGVGVYREQEHFGGAPKYESVAILPRWRPADDVEIIPFWSRIDLYNREAAPLYTPEGAFLPPRIERDVVSRRVCTGKRQRGPERVTRRRDPHHARDGRR